MKKIFCITGFFTLLLSFNPVAQPTKQDSFTVPEGPDTVTVGIYVNSIHDIDFKAKEFTVNFWVWFKYKKKEFDFVSNIEVPNAKTVVKSFTTVDTTGGRYFVTMKLQCVMKDSWKIAYFPFDVQKLRISIENSQFDTRYLVFAADTAGSEYDKRFTLDGWTIDSFMVIPGKRIYETAFGDEHLPKPQSEYASYRIRMSVTRNAGGLFWKMFLGMYVAFLIAFVCFFIHADGIDSRFGLSVGALFAVIGNKYIIDSSLPESTTYTLVDTLHALTLFFIFAVITATAYSLKLVKANKIKQARRFDMLAAQVMLMVYLILNIWFIWQAQQG